MSDLALSQAPSPALSQAAAGTVAKEPGGFKPFGDDGFNFYDILDIINPLQHIPLISAIYRHFTGDELAAAPRIAGGALFGGAIGAAVAVVNVVFDESTGKDLGEHVIAFFSDDQPGDGPVVVAANPREANFVTSAGAPQPVPAALYGSYGRPATFWSQEQLMPPSVTVETLPPPGLAQSRMPPALATAPASPPPAETIQVRTVAGLTSATTFETLLMEAESNALAATAAQYQVVSAAANGGGEQYSRKPAAGAMAEDGGWFSEVMLTALGKYRSSAALTATAPPPPGTAY